VLIALQRLDVETIAVDRFDNARPARWPAMRTITMSDRSGATQNADDQSRATHLVVREIEAIATMLQELSRRSGACGFPPRRAMIWTARHPPPGC
jgi:formate-dependent phosphoribosylglycinamide formyltransferase (GAR transformylase)